MEFKKVNTVEEAIGMVNALFRRACKTNDTFHIMLSMPKGNRGLADEIAAELEETYSRSLYKGSMTYEIHPLAKGVEVAYQNLSEQGLLIKKYYGEGVEKLSSGEINALCDAVGAEEYEIKKAFKDGLSIWTLEEYKESLADCGLTEEEIADSIRKADVIDGYIVERY